MDTKCIRFNGTAPDWRALFSEQLDDLTRSKSSADFEIRVNSVLSRGGLSHVAFFHESAQRAPARYAINATFCSADTLGRTPVDVSGCARRRARLHGWRPSWRHPVGGQWDVDPPPALPTFALGTDAAVTIDSADGEVGRCAVSSAEGASERKGEGHTADGGADERDGSNHRPGDSRLCAGRVFSWRQRATVRPRARSLRSPSSSGCTRLIVDLRGNLGGFVGSLRLMSHLTPDRIPVGYSLTRKGEDRKLATRSTRVYRPAAGDQTRHVEDGVPVSRWSTGIVRFDS